MSSLEDIENLESGEVVFLKLKSDDLRQISMDLTERILENGDLVIYLSFTKQASKLKDILEDRDVNVKQVLFFDCLTKSIGTAPDRAENTVFFQPSGLTNIQMKLEDAIESIPEDRKGYIILDSVDAATTYNEEKTLRKFIKSITAKMRSWDAQSVLIGLEEGMDSGMEGELKKSTEETMEIELD
ncbi:MAG: hypothetical protein ABEJ87_06160 [Candidatus Nanohalobium sp.]